MKAPDRTSLFTAKRHCALNASTVLGTNVLDQFEDQSYVDTWPSLHSLKALCLKEHASLNALCHTGAPAMITLHVSSNRP